MIDPDLIAVITDGIDRVIECVCGHRERGLTPRTVEAARQRHAEQCEGPEPLLAATRDASVWDRPNTRSRKRLHVAVNVQALPDTWWETGERTGEAACDPGRMPLDMSVASPAETIPEERRCRRPGCAARWPAHRLDLTAEPARDENPARSPFSP